jgi:hypothetical protein
MTQIREKYPWTGEERNHRRKDFRKGVHPAQALSSHLCLIDVQAWR